MDSLSKEGSNQMRGSEWRKWDLHLHSPGTKKNDGYRVASGDVWDEYCRILEVSDICAFGITDYFSVDGYIKTCGEFRKRYPQSRKRFFANVELCLNVVANKDNDYINIHVIFNPAKTDDELRRFLGHLKTIVTVNSKPTFAADLASTSDYNEATTTHDCIEHALEMTFGTADRLEHVLIVPAVNNDGIRPAAGVAKRAAVSNELDKFADAFFGNSKSVGHYSDPGRYGQSEVAKPRAVLTGSDAHSFEDLNECLGKTVLRNGQIYKQITWIKAEVSYEGLKQIAFEPADRVYIGDEPAVLTRLREKPLRFIKTIEIGRSDTYNGRFGTWFQKEKIELNPELVAIIGNKGSGKSALTDVIGLLGNSHKQLTKGDRPEELFSFLNKEKFRKQNCAAQFQAELDWGAGGTPECRLLSAMTDDRPETVEYLPQKYLERVCANVEEEEFRTKLNEVIFGYVKSSERYGKESLEHLIAYLTNQANADIWRATDTLHASNLSVVQLERKLTVSYRQDIEERIERAEADLATHIQLRESPIAKPPEEDPQAVIVSSQITKMGGRIDELSAEAVELSKEHQRITRRTTDLQQAKQAIERLRSEVDTLRERYAPLFESVGVSYDQILSLHYDPKALDDVIDNGRVRIEEIVPALRTMQELELQDLLVGDDELREMRAASIAWRSNELERKRIELTDQLSKPSRDYQNYRLKDQQWETNRFALEGASEAPAESTLNWLRQEQARISDTYPDELAARRSQREMASKEIYKLKKGVLTFLNEIKSAIDNEIRLHGKDLPGYNISIEAGFKLSATFVEDFLRFINQGKKGSFHGSEDGRLVLQNLVASVGDWQAEADVFSVLQRIVDLLDVDARGPVDSRDASNRRDVFDQLRQGKEPAEFYDFLFGLSYLEPVYGLQVDSKTLGELSPGERGGVLLVFYLMLDRRDIPLVIDQPEDNLDNKSVYEILVKFLKKAKARRQIIIATHNPNLAVVADAEQIIYVKIDKSAASSRRNDFSFVAGGIEDLAINHAVVEILEGTAPAFDNRRLKYRRGS
jgi:ABC-type lipoprotein export system ATPase subunit